LQDEGDVVQVGQVVCHIDTSRFHKTKKLLLLKIWYSHNYNYILGSIAKLGLIVDEIKMLLM